RLGLGGRGAAAQAFERGREVAHRERQRQGAAQALAVLVVQLARALREQEAGGVPFRRAHAWASPSIEPDRRVLLGASRRGKVSTPVNVDANADAPPVVILGGGLTGISTAVHLRAPWVLFEREERLGGHARTDERDGYRFDKTGHWLHLRDPAVKNLVDELLPGEMVPVARRARIFSHGVLTRYP